MRRFLSALVVCLVMACGREASRVEDARRYTVINGKPVSGFPQVVYLDIQGARCTATLVGPRAVITAAHCGRTGQKASFTLKDKTYSGQITRAPLYVTHDHDIAMVYLSESVETITPMSIGGSAQILKDVRVFGFGCTALDATGGNDGILRAGMSRIVGFTRFDMVTQLQGGAVSCFGDSGGPVVDVSNPKYPRVLAVNSKSDIMVTSYQTRLDMTESRKFIAKWSKEVGGGVCGVTKDCD